MQGAHNRGGPLPQMNALRRDRASDKEWSHLSAVGRTGPIPEWPLVKANARELVRWAVEWQKPQAVMWEAAGQADQVAHYVRHFCEAEKPKAPTSVRVLLKQEEEILGLSLAGLLRNRWIIERVSADEPAKKPVLRSSAKARMLRAVPDAG